jgi:hypothetical protein
MDGRFRWTWSRSTDGATYGVKTKDGVLFYDNRRAHELGKDGVVRNEFDVESADVAVSFDGTVYMKTGAELWVVGDKAVSFPVGTDAELETACGDVALLRKSDGTCLLVGPDGIRGTFEAPDADFGVNETRGLWVIEDDRIRGIFPR